MKKIDLSQELREIFKSAYLETKKLDLKEITIEGFLKSLFTYYSEDKGDQNKGLKEYFKKFKDKLPDMIGGLGNELVGLSEDNPNPLDEDDDLFNPDSYALNPDLDMIVSESFSETRHMFPERLGRLDSDVLLMTLMKHSDLWVVEYMKQSGFAVEELYNTLVDMRAKEAKNAAGVVSSVIGSMADNDVKEFMNEVIGMVESELKEKRIFPQASEEEGGEEREFENAGKIEETIESEDLDPNSDTPELDRNSVDLTKKARNGEFDPVIGRDEIVDSMIEILLKRRKPNIALLSEAGTGKSAIIERLAQRIANGEVPDKLKNKRICSLNLNDLVAGTQYRGQFEERVKKIIHEVCRSKDIIISLDELHTLVSGSAGGQNDTANILKPYLARGEFQMIGATTPQEYRKYIEKDKALNRRFTQLLVNEPNAQETLKILKGISGNYEKFHHVRYSNEVLEACVELSGRYLSDKNFPDKAVDIMDMAGSLVGLRRIETSEKSSDLEEKLKVIIEKKIQAVTVDHDFEAAEGLREEEKALNEEIAREKKANQKESGKRSNWEEVKIEDINNAVSKISRIPIEKVSQSDRDKIGRMKKDLERNVIGQQEAIDTFIRAIQLNSLGLRDQRKPMCSVLAVGPSGVGKTLISKEVAVTLFGDEAHLIKINGGEFKEEHSVSKLIGAPAGYVGYEDEAIFHKVKRLKRAVVLFDEVEKISKEIMDVVLSITDQGYCEMADGERIDFSNCIIIFTGNIGTRELKNSLNIGFGRPDLEGQKKKDHSIVMKSVEKHFKPEFLNRLSAIVVFNSLGKKEMEKIFALELDKIKKSLNKSKVTIKVTNALRDYIIEGVDKNYGARDLQRGISNYVLVPVSNAMLEYPAAQKFTVDLREEDKKAIVLV